MSSTIMLSDQTSEQSICSCLFAFLSIYGNIFLYDIGKRFRCSYYIENKKQTIAEFGCNRRRFKNPMKTYYINQKLIALNEKFYIYDRNEEPYLEVVSNGLLAFIDNIFGSIFSFGHTFYVKNLNGNVFATIKKRTGFLLEKYDIYCGERKIASIKQQIAAFKPKISIKTEKDDYLISGDILGRDFIISKDGVTVATVKKTAFHIKDKYTINIFEDGNDELFLSMVIAIDNSLHN